ncbi:hypothetical protein [Hydrogenimonas sp.]
MSINLAEIQQKQDRLLANIAEQNRKAYEIFYSPTPGDVSLPQYDELGNLTAVTIPNRAKIRQQMWDDVGAAIGQMSRTFYVDAENGDDLNDGSSGAPFATIKKACDSVPTGGRGSIYLSNSADHILTLDIGIIHKNITFYAVNKAGDGSHAKIIPEQYVYSFSGNDYAAIRRFMLRNAVIGLYEIDPILPAPADGLVPYAGPGNMMLFDMGGSVVTSVNGLVLNRVDAVIPAKNDQGKQFYVAGGKYWDHSGLISISQYEAHHSIETAGTKLFYIHKQTCSFVTTSSEMTDPDGNVSYDFFDGIVFDADGKPRNITSNLVF